MEIYSETRTTMITLPRSYKDKIEFFVTFSTSGL